MIRALAPLAALLLMAGCLALPEADEFDAAAIEPPITRIEGMTVNETITDSIVDCQGSNGQILLLEIPAACAQRIVDAKGLMGVDRLPVELVGSNGEIVIRTSADDSWSFLATIVVQDTDEDRAREALDTAWTWSHEKDGEHAIVAGPTPQAAPIVLGMGPRVVASAYELTIPAWVAIDLKALTDNGGIAAEGFRFGAIDVETDNGNIVLSGSAASFRGKTDNGGIRAELQPIASGSWELETDNGEILLQVPEGRRFGYDIDGAFDNGQVIIQLEDGELTEREDGASFTTNGFAERAVQTTMTLQVDNGQIIVGSS